MLTGIYAGFGDPAQAAQLLVVPESNGSTLIRKKHERHAVVPQMWQLSHVAVDGNPTTSCQHIQGYLK